MIASIHKEAFSGVHIKSLDLSHNNLTEIPVAIQQLSSLEHLDLSHNQIKSLGTHMLTSLKCLKTLQLHNNKIRHVLRDSLIGLTSLQNLNLSRNKIRSISADFCKEFQLQVLDLSYNFLSHIPPNLLSIRTLDVRHNRVLKVNDSNSIMMGGTVTEILVDLSHANLVMNPETVLYSQKVTLTKVTTVVLHHCKLTEVNQLFKGFPALEELDISYNDISKLHADTFKGLNRLKTLQLKHNNLTNILSSHFEHVTNLTWLDVSSNMIQHLQSDCFAQMSKLKHLSLSNNHIFFLELELFQNLTDLEVLDLSSNELTTTPSLHSCANMKKLYLHNNYISKLGELQLPKLEELFLHHNLISSIANTSAFDTLTSLKILDLRFNPLSDISILHFVALQQLHTLGIRSSLTTEWNNTKMPTLLSGNSTSVVLTPTSKIEYHHFDTIQQSKKYSKMWFIPFRSYPHSVGHLMLLKVLRATEKDRAFLLKSRVHGVLTNGDYRALLSALQYLQLIKGEISTPTKQIATSQPVEPQHTALPSSIEFKPDDFVKGKLLGTGSYAEVYLVVHKHNGGVYAAKYFTLAKLSPSERIELVNSFYKEIEAMSQLRHPNIAQFIGCYKEADDMILFMTYYDTSLRAYIDAKANSSVKTWFSESDIINWCLQIAAALKYLHSQSPPVVHRDLKVRFRFFFE
jgi:Leucine-rich repeat (LRR) protein